MGKANRSLACARCRGGLELVSGASGESIALSCLACGLRVPVLAGIPVFAETDLEGGEDIQRWHDSLAERLQVTPGIVPHFLSERGPVDAYAAFQPFNESARAFDSLVELARGALRPGDLILDTWNRTGWTGERLAALFPEQRVISLWEGPFGAMGLRGFTAWLPEGRCAPNLTLVMASPGEPLPLASGTCALVHAYDSLHRYPQHVLLPELERVATPNAPLVFAHVHLQSPQAPPFEREGRLRSGAEWARSLERRVGTARRVYVIGEAGLFARQQDVPPPVLRSDPSTADYNAMIALLPSAWDACPLARLPAPLDAGDALVSNPLLSISALDGTVGLAALSATILPRHLVYAERLTARLPGRLDAEERVLCYWAGRLPSLGAIAERLGLDVRALLSVAERLVRAEILRAVPLGPAAHRLQRFHATRETAPLADEDDLPALWRRAVGGFAGRTYLTDDEAGQGITYAEADALIAAAAARLHASGIRAGDRVALWAAAHIEGFLLLWAAAHVGACVASIGPDTPVDVGLAMLQRVGPRQVFADRTHSAAVATAGFPVVVLDEEGVEHGFAAWLSDAGAPPPLPTGLARLPAVILFTSGTSGAAKGVVLSQQALSSSGRLMAREGGLRDDDVHLALGDLHTMSGLRNPWLATAWAGGATVVAGTAARADPTAVLELLARRRISVVTAVPAALRLLSRCAHGKGRPTSLRLVLCTGTHLPEEVRVEFESAFGASVHDYYGLTETGGLCVGHRPGHAASPGAIGVPVDALVRVVDDAGCEVTPGQIGELQIHSAQLSDGYLDVAVGGDATIRSGAWLATGDLVRVEAEELVLVGRRREIFKNRRGELVPLHDVEALLRTCPGVADAAVYAHRNGIEEELWVMVTPTTDPPMCTTALIEQVCVRMKAAGCSPARMRVRPHIPRGATGKVAHALWHEQEDTVAAR